jgi:TetR/AcrR family transcriptional regulator, regulator of autoinduction and epiphytic fitness
MTSLSISSKMSSETTALPGPDPRQKNLLVASLSVFLRYGFRKTSMEEVARAAQISRQGLYLHFKTKEDLFRATVRHFLDETRLAASAALEDEALPLKERLAGAFDAFMGRFVGMFGTDAEDLAEASSALVGDLIAVHEQGFIEQLAKIMRTGSLLAAYKPAGLTAKQLAETLYATARGLKYGARTPAEFTERMAVAIRVLLAVEARGAGREQNLDQSRARERAPRRKDAR